MASAEAIELGDGPVSNLINKRIRALRKKFNRIAQMEESIAQGKPINKEQEDVLRTKSGVSALIDELEKLRQPLSLALHEELSLALERHHQQPVSSSAFVSDTQLPLPNADEQTTISEDSSAKNTFDFPVEDLLNLLYFGSLFDVKPQNDYTSTMLTRTHERGSCLTYDYVTDDATDILGECDLDMISMLSGLLISRPVDSTLSHMNALQRCVEHAKLWIEKSPLPVEPRSQITYADLRERLNKIMASDYFTTSPQMKTSVDVAAYSSFQVPLPVPVHQGEGSLEQYQQQVEVTPDFEAQEEEKSPNDLPTIHVDELPQKDEVVNGDVGDSQISGQNESTTQVEKMNGGEVEVEQQKQQYVATRRSHQNQRGMRFGWRGGYNGRGRGGRGGYQMNERGGGQHYNNNGNYYDGGNYNNGRMYRERGGGRVGVGQQQQKQQSYYNNNNHMAGVEVGYSGGE